LWQSFYRRYAPTYRGLGDFYLGLLAMKTAMQIDIDQCPYREVGLIKPARFLGDNIYRRPAKKAARR
jgi:hypothetical protein